MRLVLFTIFLFCTPAFAQAAGQFIKVKGEQVKIDFNDGRVAGLYQGAFDNQTVALPFVVDQNSCNDKGDFPAGSYNCRIQTTTTSDYRGFQWLKNPDANKIGKTLKLVGQTYNPFEERTNTQSLDLLSPQKAALYADRLPRARIVCDNYEWLPNATSMPVGAKLKVIKWSGQGMNFNPETLVSELRLGGELDGVTLVKLDDKQFEVSSADFFSGSYVPSDVLPIITTNMQTTAIWLVPLRRDVCQMSLAAKSDFDFGAIVKILSDFSVVAPSVLTPLIFDGGPIGSYIENNTAGYLGNPEGIE